MQLESLDFALLTHDIRTKPLRVAVDKILKINSPTRYLLKLINIIDSIQLKRLLLRFLCQYYITYNAKVDICGSQWEGSMSSLYMILNRPTHQPIETRIILHKSLHFN